MTWLSQLPLCQGFMCPACLQLWGVILSVAVRSLLRIAYSKLFTYWLPLLITQCNNFIVPENIHSLPIEGFFLFDFPHTSGNSSIVPYCPLVPLGFLLTILGVDMDIFWNCLLFYTGFFVQLHKIIHSPVCSLCLSYLSCMASLDAIQESLVSHKTNT